MDDSDQDFVDVRSHQPRRVRKKAGEGKLRRPGRAEQRPCTQAGDGERGGGRGSRCVAVLSATQPARVGAGQLGVSGGPGRGSEGAGSGVPAGSAPPPSLKEKVLGRMQQFKRAPPQRMAHNDKGQPAGQESCSGALPPVSGGQDTSQPSSSGLRLKPDSDEALALRLQRELDLEAAEAQTVNLEDEGLFFCQICQRDLTHMTPEGRTLHINRCLDETEGHVPAPPPPPPGVPDCPICGKKFKSQKSRSAHLKRCSSDMGVSPAALLQALQRQAEDAPRAASAHTLTQPGGTKRKGASKPGLPARKKPRKKTDPLDEDAMVALALSSSLLEQEAEQQRRREAEGASQTELAAPHTSMTPVFKWRPDAGKGRVKRRKGAVPRPPPLLLVQDAEAALARLQERVSALLLRTRAPSPPTPTRCPSSVPGWSGAAPLWQKSALLNEGSSCLSDFYVPELRGFIRPWESTEVPCDTTKRDTPLQPVQEGTPVAKTQGSVQPSSQTPSRCPPPSSPGTGLLPVGSQALRDLIELADDGMTLTQCGYTATAKDKSIGPSTNLHLSGFIWEEPADLCASGFLPETAHTHTKDSRPEAGGSTDRRSGQASVLLSRLASDLSSMVNNPQLSDVQLQVDSGEVFFAHSFMVFARCPLLAEMVHESAIGVQEDGMPAAQRVLISDVPGQAVLALLQYLYTAQFSIPASLQPHVLELASRFDLQELQQLCEFHQGDAAVQGDEEDGTSRGGHPTDQMDQNLTALLRTMWNKEEDDDDDRADESGGTDEERGLGNDHDISTGDRGIQEEHVNEDELEEIYEFAATQRKREEEENNSMGENVDEEDQEVVTKGIEPKRSSGGLSGKNSELDPDLCLDTSYNRLFSGSGNKEKEDPSSFNSTSFQPKMHTSRLETHQFPQTPSSKVFGRTLLQSSASIMDEISLSPCPSTSNLPVPGLSPGQVGDRDGGGDKGTGAGELELSKECVSLKRESQGPRSSSVPLIPNSPQKKMEPELVVLSDSSEDMDADIAVLSSLSPSPRSPCTAQTTQSYTQIKPQPIAKPNVNNRSSSFGLSPDSPSSARVPSPPVTGCDQSPGDCSPEVSWLIPSTPVQPVSTRTGSTPTKSSMRRMQLFPKGGTSSVSSPVFSSPDSPFNNKHQTSSSPTVHEQASQTDSSVLRIKQERTAPFTSSEDLNFSPTRTSDVPSKNREVDSPVFEEPLCQPKKPSNSTHPHPHPCSSKQNTPLHLQLQPHSSTPLHADVFQSADLLAASPVYTGQDKQRLGSQEKDRLPSESPEKMVLGSLHLSMSDPSDPHSYRRLQSSQRRFKSSDEDREREKDLNSKGTDDEDQCQARLQSEEAEVTDSSSTQSLMIMDEPPMAFNDSWGLDAGVDSPANPGCFSLRLEESGGTSLQEHSPGPGASAASTILKPAPSSDRIQSFTSQRAAITPPPPETLSSQASAGKQTRAGHSVTPSRPDPASGSPPENSNGLLDSKIWDSWDEDEEEVLPLSQRLNPSAQLKTPVASYTKRRRSVVPITPMPHYSDLDTPELKNKLNRFGVRPLPKRQMILKLKEIHQYTHQLASSDSEDEAARAGGAARTKPPLSGAAAAGGGGPLCPGQTVNFKEPRAPVAVSPVKPMREVGGEAELLSASQDSSTSSVAASEESERSNPELCASSDGDSESDGGITASQAVRRLQDRLQAVRSFILSDARLYSQILQYQPLVLSHLQQQLKAAGIRLGTAKLMDYLDSQCITFTTAKAGHSAGSRGRPKRTGKTAKAAGKSGASRKRGAPTMI